MSTSEAEPSGSATSGAPGSRRTRPAPRRLQVVRVAPLADDMVTVTLGGPALAGFALPRPAHHIKIFLPVDGQREPTVPAWAPDGRPVFPAGQPRPVVRTYTPRRFDPDALELDIEMLLHAGGPAGRWAAAARPGNHLAIAGPGGGYEVPAGAAHHLLAADETGLPALATILERLPPAEGVTVLAEVRDAGRRRELPVNAAATVTWLHRGTRVAGELLAESVAAASLPAGTAAWVACEASAVRRIRRQLLGSGLDRGRISTRGYWRLGAADHPDHDFGEVDLADVARGGGGRGDRLRSTLGPLKSRARNAAREVRAALRERGDGRTR
ncbi:siderophore-interacting protein [Frankia torreyi]|uniref:Siderophore-interacting protein n=2 Tax=Frankia TaxID=1854 RepID=A0A0D8BJM4_9ACTN|nr:MULTISPECIES: siderophore-interacting protein [Frankia]KJE24260.1 siderophore-interacting protein [Frankia torreyi]KQM06864.1 siderophore-interacting protein [Frankia sp. CpI1-P]